MTDTNMCSNFGGKLDSPPLDDKVDPGSQLLLIFISLARRSV